MNPDIYEKSGVFYLGRKLSSEDFSSTEEPFLYDARDLTTHAVCVGMTGSGKTGLGIAVLEEAAMDRIPAIVIDPKGDIGNMLLTFPSLDPASFLPWVSEEEATRKGVTREELAVQVANTWSKGLHSWGQTGARISRLRETVDMAIFTPGSTAGRPLALLRSLRAPSAELRGDGDLYRERIADTVSGLLDLAGIRADPIQSREHILMSTILQQAWDTGEDLDLASFVGRIPNPNIQRIGAFDLDSFFPSKDRFAFAMRMNALLASPSFAAWTEGEPLDIDQLLQAPDGRPRVSILSIAHLSDAERMFLVTSVVGELISWTRRQRGTSSLRALFYMDEMFGYLPPVAEPPSKRGLLTLLKQARAFGLGLMLCTQNPADIDYKALSNAGTWFIGRLQTERDRDRLLDGMASSMDAGGRGLDRGQLERLIGGLGSRRFVVQNAHQGYAELFETRWVMSYLAGPLSRTQVRTLAAPDATAIAARSRAPEVALGGTPAATVTEPAREAPTPSSMPEGFVAAKPALPPAIRQAYVKIGERANEGETLLWRPMVLGTGTATIDRKRPPVQAVLPLARIAFVENRPVPLVWEDAIECPFDGRALANRPEAPGFWELPAPAQTDATWYRSWERDLVSYWATSAGVPVYQSRALKLMSEVGEREEAFRQRVELAAREARDAAKDSLSATYRTRLMRLDDKIAGYEARANTSQRAARERQMRGLVQLGGALFGGRSARSLSSTGTQVARHEGVARRALDQRGTALAERELLAEEFRVKLEAIEDRFAEDARTIVSSLVTPPKSGVQIRFFGLVWVPYYAAPDGSRRRAWVARSMG